MGNEVSSNNRNVQKTSITKAMEGVQKTHSDTVKVEDKQNLADTTPSKASGENSNSMAEEDLFKDLSGIIQDVQSTSRLVLQKLNEAVSGQECTCECHSEEKQKELAELKSRIEALENDGKKKDEVLSHLADELTAFRDALKQLQNSYTPGGEKGLQASYIPEGVKDLQTSYLPEDEKREDKDKVVLDNADKRKDTGRAPESNANIPNEAKKEEADCESVIELDSEGSESSVLEEAVEMSCETVEFVSDEEARGSDYINTVLSQKVDHQTGDNNTGGNGTGKNAVGSVTSGIVKPNFRVAPSIPAQTSVQQTAQVQVIHQTRARYFPNEQAWLAMASTEIQTAQESGLKDLGGIHSVVCVDISASIAEGNGWAQTKTFCHDYFNGLVKVAVQHGLDQEYVALVTFGHNCSVVQRFTNKMGDVLQKFDSLQVGGPSPMFAGLYFALAAAGSSDKTSAHVKGVRVNTKIIVITDGEPTDACLYEGPDTVELWKKDTTMAHLLQAVEKIRSSNVDLFLVPVGNSNKDFFELMQSVGDCKILGYEDGEKTSRRLFLTFQLEPLDFLGSMLGSSQRTTGTDLSESDKALMEEIKKDGEKRMFDDLISGRMGDKDKYKESTNEKFPPVGTRVRRGPDWSWNEQDSHGLGTVIGHVSEGGQLWVQWDADDHINVYNYDGNKYDVLPVDEPRIISHRDRLQVGCVVKPGKDWKESDSSVKSFDRGEVIKVLADGTKLEDAINVKKFGSGRGAKLPRISSGSKLFTEVRWHNAKRGEYVFEVNGKQEVEFSPPQDIWPSHGGYVLGGGESIKKTKNKNKNQ